MRDNPFILVALVAVDLLWLDDESICDVPLLERRRLLESVLTESQLVRVGVFVKPPIDRWLGGWRSGRIQPPRIQGREQPLCPGRQEPRLGHRRDPPPLRAAVAPGRRGR